MGLVGGWWRGAARRHVALLWLPPPFQGSTAACPPASQDGIHYTVECGIDTFSLTTANWVKTQMVPLAIQRDSSCHLLKGDRLAVRVSMRLVPPAAAAAGAAVEGGWPPGAGPAVAPAAPDDEGSEHEGS